jgi:hypothetical protein
VLPHLVPHTSYNAVTDLQATDIVPGSMYSISRILKLTEQVGFPVVGSILCVQKLKRSSAHWQALRGAAGRQLSTANGEIVRSSLCALQLAG